MGAVVDHVIRDMIADFVVVDYVGPRVGSLGRDLGHRRIVETRFFPLGRVF